MLYLIFNFNQNIYNKNVHVMNPHGIGDVVMIVPLVAEILSYNPKQLSFTLKSKLEAEVLNLFFPEQEFKIIFLKNIYEIIKLILSPKKSIQKSKRRSDNDKDEQDIYPLW